jgi:hypothetical protein
MNLKSLRKLLAFGLIAVAGYCWGTPSLPQNDEPKWQDISSIQWSTNNGASWGNSALVVGQSVEFKISMHKTYDGKHYADLIKAWFDFDGNGLFETGESALFGAHVVKPSYVDNTGPGNSVNQSFDFKSGPINLTSAMVGDHFLLARVTCSESLLTSQGINVNANWGIQWSNTYTNNGNALYNQYFSPTARYGQGESEVVKLSVNSVPEPSTLALFAIAMVGMGLRRKQAIHI